LALVAAARSTWAGHHDRSRGDLDSRETWRRPFSSAVARLADRLPAWCGARPV